MKLFNKIILSLCVLIFSLCSENGLRNNLNTKAVKCTISTISIPKGSNMPVVVFRANSGEEDVNLTVMDKQDLNKYKVNGNLVFEDKTNGESWFAENKYNENNFESMRDAFSLCKTIHDDNKGNKLYDDNESNRKNKKSLLQYRIQTLPDNIEVIDDKEKTNVAKDINTTEFNSFLQSKETMIASNKLKNSSKAEKALTKLETGFKFDSFIRLKEMFNFNDIHF
jgi:hypothetical protein